MKITKCENYRVLIFPDVRFTRLTEEQECKRIESEIKRHVDDLGTIRIKWDVNSTCSFCGYEWEIDCAGCPQCCNAAIEEFKKGNYNK
jgi:hypothetical protein